MANLLLIAPNGVKLIQLSGPMVTIGRSEKCTVVIDRLPVSRLHAALTSVDGGFSICDLDSRNGVFVNGVKVHRRTLRHGDSICLGDCEMRYLDAPAHAAPSQLSLAA